MSAPFVSRLERLGRVDSTQRVVREWLEAGVPEVAVAVADEQTAGRGRQGRTWTAPPGVALLVSAGFRPTPLPVRHGWRLAAIAALAMLDAAEEAAGLRDGTLLLKWPNDLVAESPDGRLLKVAGLLGEADLSGDRLDRVVVGLGINVDWAARDFPPSLAASMSSLRELAGGRPVDREDLLEGWLARLEPRCEALRSGAFDAGGWSARQATTGRRVEVEIGGEVVVGRGHGVDPEGGSLLLEPEAGGAIRAVGAGEVVRCRVARAPAGA